MLIHICDIVFITKVSRVLFQMILLEKGIVGYEKCDDIKNDSKIYVNI